MEAEKRRKRRRIVVVGGGFGGAEVAGEFEVFLRRASGRFANVDKGEISVTLVALGCRTGVARIGPIKLAGFAAWFLWRTVYLMKMPGWGRRLRVALEWTIALFFGQDDVQLGVLATGTKVARTPDGTSG